MANYEKRISQMYREAAKKQAEEARDTVRVVRCKDCKYYYAYPDEYRTCHEHYEIDGATKMMATEDFCSCGVRREVSHDPS